MIYDSSKLCWKLCLSVIGNSFQVSYSTYLSMEILKAQKTVDQLVSMREHLRIVTA